MGTVVKDKIQYKTKKENIIKLNNYLKKVNSKPIKK